MKPQMSFDRHVASCPLFNLRKSQLHVCHVGIYGIVFLSAHHLSTSSSKAKTNQSTKLKSTGKSISSTINMRTDTESYVAC